MGLSDLLRCAVPAIHAGLRMPLCRPCALRYCLIAKAAELCMRAFAQGLRTGIQNADIPGPALSFLVDSWVALSLVKGG